MDKEKIPLEKMTFDVKLVKELLFETKKINGKEVKYSPDKKIYYPFER